MNRQSGSTLVELAVALALVAVLASLALPGFRSQVLRANRTEARAALLALAAAEEKFHLDCGTYAATLDSTARSSCSPATLRFAGISERGYYAVGVTSADVDHWSGAATAIASGTQFADEACRVFKLDGDGARSATDGAGASNTRTCWDR